MSGKTSSKLFRYFAVRATLAVLFITVIIFIYFQVFLRPPRSDNDTWNSQKLYENRNPSKSLSASVTTIKKSSPFDLEFHDLNVSGVYSFRNVCIETVIDTKSLNESYRIVVYNNIYGSSKIFAKIFVTDTALNAVHLSNWSVYFMSGPIPEHHRILPTSAFFVPPTFMKNLYHFWNDIFVRIFSVIRSTNRLHVGMKNQILYSAHHRQDERITYEDILRTLYTNEFYDVYYKLPTNTCYSSAVFGAKNSLERFRDAVDHVLMRFNISQRSEEDVKDRVVIIRRANRQIINIDDLKEAAESIGFKSVKVVAFEKMTLKEQTQVAANTRVMVGVQGGGLLWSIFMPPGSTLIEFAWPQKYWYPFFNFVQTYDINYMNVTVTDVRVNWTTFEARTQRKKKCSKEEQLQLLNMTHKQMWNKFNIWKHADVLVDVDEFKRIMKTLKSV